MAQQNIQILIQAKDQASRTLRDVSSELDKGVESSSRYSAALSNAGRVVGGATLALGAAAVTAASAGAAIGLKFNSSVEQATARLMAFTKDGEQVARTLDWVKREAALTQFSFEDMANAAADLTPIARSSGQSLEALVQQAEILAALNPAEGLTGAVFSLREALSGDWVSIVDRFNLPRKRINELKEQGVPAMEIISRTLREMGIDYDLVSKQGETAAARWDQVKDKFTMAFGRATEPLFERIKQGLDGLNQLDFDSLGESLAGGMQTALDAVDNVHGALKTLATGQFVPEWFKGLEEDNPVIGFLIELHGAFKAAWDFMRPAIDELGKAFRERLLPAIKDLWEEVSPTLIPALKALAVILGGALVGGLFLLVKGITAVVHIFSGVIDTIRMVHEGFVNFVSFIVTAVVDAFNSIRTGFEGIPRFISELWANITRSVSDGVAAVGQFFADLPANIAFFLGQMAGKMFDFITITLPEFIASVGRWFSELPANVANGLSSMWETVTSWFSRTSNDAVTNTTNLVNGVVGWFQTLPQRLAEAAVGIWEAVSKGFFDFGRAVINWARDVVNSVVNFFKEIPNRVTGAIGGAFEGVKSWVSDIGKNFTAGFQARAVGSNYAPGGMTLVGENGPELVRMPMGAQITPAWQTRAQGGGAGSVYETNINGPMHFHTAAAVNTFFDQIDKSQRLARLGAAGGSL